ncbi:MAG: M23 family metallopeptidase [Clostridiales bacterium]|jgi:murein DD-endopeptidase MepM/ murein hydrolase activator NlpD|nr:M23 family metallopeptidase [Clostridiales bacterium]
MKDKKQSKKPGFYIALYLCVATVLSIAGVLAYQGFAPAPEKTPPVAQKEQNEPPPAREANKSTIAEGSFLTPKDGKKPGAGDNIKPAAPAPKEAPAPALPPAQAAPAPAAQSAPPKAEAAAPAPKEETKPAFDEFKDDGEMLWPTIGDVVMGYSPDHAVYDVTLDQYRTNDSICISAKLGAQVRAAAAGRVKEVSKSKENGNKVVIDHGNNWETTYTQLQDNALVSVGDVVKAGQVIGGVGKPSIYSVLLGEHLGFTVSNADGTVNPESVMAKS